MFFLGIEMGPLMARVMALDLESADASIIATAPLSAIEGLPEGFVEQDPTRWLGALDQAVREVLEKLGAGRERVVALGVTAAEGGLVVLDAADRVIRPAKLGVDRSAQSQAEKIAREFGGAPGVIELIGNAPEAGSLASQLLWLRDHEPRHFQQVAQVLTPQDFVGYWLTGEGGSSASSAATTGLFSVPTRSWCREMAEWIDPAVGEMLPSGLVETSPRGRLRPALAQAWGLSEGVWVAPGLGARAAMLFASGTARPGEGVADLSADGGMAAVSEQPLVDFLGEGTIGCEVSGHGFTRMALRNIVAAPELVRRHYGWSKAEFEKAIASAAPGAEGLTFLPYLRGEEVPKLPDAQGLIHGMTLNNFTPANLARAAAEGVALSFGYAVSRLREMGFELNELRLVHDPGPTGGALLADVCDLPTVPVKGGGGALLGAAMQAAAVYFHEQGETLGFDEIAGYVVTPVEASRRQPDPGRRDLYAQLLARQQYLVETLHAGGFL
ncbi:sugar (pentulose or hexulose) kinase [Haloferula luteola]|uniref:Sugar (Pentulose or hexulose) kinase n=1 Tax=Haloferula luteola TaxID=595692 RepID=A0A840V2R0_9BACT|nr:FGGY family carbohydrate kinase [Haloferula luteola]MBB5351336.1 sugar (pentulose or hexulose) kinase [Haloferula luteola]